MLALNTRSAPLGRQATPDTTHPMSLGQDGKGPAILFADVSRSVLLHERLGDHEARNVIDSLLRSATKAVKANRGRVIKTLGDEILAVLPTADAAAQAARELLTEVDGRKARGGIALGMHVGLHSGAFIERDGDVFGDAVNVASRLTAHAQAGQILTTSASVGGLSPLVRATMRTLGPLDIRGRSAPVQVEEILWRKSLDEEATFTGGNALEALPGTRLVMWLGDRSWTMEAGCGQMVVGRSPAADIEIGSTDASRSHGIIEYRNGGFVYMDTSLNGSWVSFRAGGETLVQRGQVLLSGQGILCFGRPAAEGGDRLVFGVERVEA
jgi:adenylate cyclase